MKNGFTEYHFVDENGNPAGGHTFGNGFAIAWQNGPLGRGEDRKPPNGAFVEDVLAAVRGRLEVYQASRFASTWNQRALQAISEAQKALYERTLDRETRSVEGTHQK